MKLTALQLHFIEKKGLSEADIFNQIAAFKKGSQPLDLVRPACLGDGIIQLNPEIFTDLLESYQTLIEEKVVAKFIPASGAATRMFKDLYTFLESGIMSPFVKQFFDHIKAFAFYPFLKLELKNKGFSIENLVAKKQFDIIIEALLNKEGLSYGHLPKGLLKFHHHNGKYHTPVFEQINEFLYYGGKKPKLVLTISEEFENSFKEEIENTLVQLSVKNMDTELSFQKSKTDTIAVNSKFKWIEVSESELLMRPGGHGSLIENLNEIEADIIFIKNIDNVCANSLLEETINYKKVLGSHLLKVQSRIFNYINLLENSDSKADLYKEIMAFIENELCVYSSNYNNMNANEKFEYMIGVLNRPLRVCGMVKNEGEPGGGPFWVRDREGKIALQIVESSQINLKNELQSSIFAQSTHFNPVDIVCALKTSNGNRFDIRKFVDKEAYFISEKSFRGEPILAYEHPGLWNGGMANWNTVFVEVSSKTFNPVKTINDLLRKEHLN